MAKAERLIGICAAALAAGFWAAPAQAAPTAADLAKWVAANTDLSAARIAIAGPEQVYSLEQLGPRTSTGEVIALVRSENLAADPLAGLQSWEAHLLFDCANGRLRQIRSVSWPERNRKGKPEQQPPREGWIVPKPEQPAMQLLAAACDPTYAWPLSAATMTTAAAPPPAAPRPSSATYTPPPPTPAARLPAPQPEYLPDIRPARTQLPSPVASVASQPPSVAAQSPALVAAPSPVASGYGVQLARGPNPDGARRALVKARKTLGPMADGLTATTDLSHVGSAPRYTAVLAGFLTEAAAKEACGKLAAAGQSCFAVQR